MQILVLFVEFPTFSNHKMSITLLILLKCRELYFDNSIAKLIKNVKSPMFIRIFIFVIIDSMWGGLGMSRGELLAL